MRIAHLAVACLMYAHFTNDDESYRRFLKATSGRPDLARADHRKALLVWLNSWGCRQFARKWHDLASEEIRSWYEEYKDVLCPTDKDLWELSGSELAVAARAYASLSIRTVSWYRRKDKRDPLRKTAGPVGAAKILFAIRPRALPPWDNRIRAHFRYDRSRASYLAYLRRVRSIVQDLEAQCVDRDLELADLPNYLGRGTSTVPKLVDEFHWVTITKGLPVSGLDDF